MPIPFSFSTHLFLYCTVNLIFPSSSLLLYCVYSNAQTVVLILNICGSEPSFSLCLHYLCLSWWPREKKDGAVFCSGQENKAFTLRHTEANNNAYSAVVGRRGDRRWYTWVFPSWWMDDRARICKHLRSPGIDSKESALPPAYVARRAGTTDDNPLLNRFPRLLKRLQIRAQIPPRIPPPCCTFYNTVHYFSLWKHKNIPQRRPIVS
jgi:hypothetical protein